MPCWNNWAMFLIIKDSTTKINQLYGTWLWQAPEVHLIQYVFLYHPKHFKLLSLRSVKNCMISTKMQETNTLLFGTLTYSEDTRSMFSGFRSVWIRRKSCISTLKYNKQILKKRVKLAPSHDNQKRKSARLVRKRQNREGQQKLRMIDTHATDSNSWRPNSRTSSTGKGQYLFLFRKSYKLGPSFSQTW